MRKLRMAFVSVVAVAGVLGVPVAAQAAPGDLSVVCGIGAPSGSVLVWYTYSAAISCVTPPGAIYNASEVEQVTGFPIGTNVTVCATSPYPVGWSITYSGFPKSGCNLNPTGVGYGMVVTRRS